MKDTFLQRAQQSTRILIDGVEVNPSEVGIDVTPYESTSSEIEIRINKEALTHELLETREPVDLDSLETYVRNDIEKFPFDALVGYLGIAQSILRGPEKSKVFRLFSMRNVKNCIRWTIARIDVVEMNDDSLILRGPVRCLQNE